MATRRSLHEVRVAVEGSEMGWFHPIRAYAVQFEAEYDYPRKFTYSGCAYVLSSGRFCGKSTHGGPKCEHVAVYGLVVEFFRFDVYFTDGSSAGRPLKGTLFDAAFNLLNVTAEELKRKSETEQWLAVYKSILEHPLCEISMRVSVGGDVVVQSLTRVRNSRVGFNSSAVAQHQLEPNPITPSKTPSKKTTQPSTSTSVDQSASTTVIENLMLKEKLSEVVELLSTRLGDLAASDDEGGD